MGNLPNVKITLGNGNIGRVASSDDGVAGMILTGTAVAGKLKLNEHYLLSSTSDLGTFGVTEENNFLIDKEVRAFYSTAGNGQELHLIVVSEATLLADVCSADADSPLNKLIEMGGGRIRLVGVNKLPATGYTPTLTKGIDGDAITAATTAQQVAVAQTEEIRPFRLLMPACGWSGEATGESFFKPSTNSTNRVAFVLASDDKTNKTAAIGQVLGRASAIKVHQNIGRVKDGAIASDGYFTDGSNYLEKQGVVSLLYDAGYIFYRKYSKRNGCYLSDDQMAVPVTDDYSSLHLGRVIDKASVIVYDTYIGEIMDNVTVDANGDIPAGVCASFEGMIENAIGNAMGSEISDFSAYINPKQNVLSTSSIEIQGELVPQGMVRKINFALSFNNPSKT